MKALKLSAVIFTALAALSACKTAPGGGENGGGSVAGMDSYRLINNRDNGAGFIATRTTEVDFDAGLTKFTFIESVSFNGTADVGVGLGEQTFNNDIADKEEAAGDLTELPNPDAFQFRVKDKDIDNTGLSGYKIYSLANVTAKIWRSSKVNGYDWKEGSNNDLVNNASQKAFYIKKDGNKLIFMIVDITGSTIRFNDDNDPRSPNEENTFTKK